MVALNELFIFSAYITIILLLYIILLHCMVAFDYCGNPTTAHPVVKVCAADSPAILRWSGLICPVAGGALFLLSPFGKRLYVNPGFGSR